MFFFIIQKIKQTNKQKQKQKQKQNKNKTKNYLIAWY